MDFYRKNSDKIGDEFIILDSPGKSELDNYSYILSKFSLKIRFKNGNIKLNNENIKGEFFDVLRREMNKNKPLKYKKRDFFTGGVVGLVSYDYNRYLEKLPSLAEDDLNLPDLDFVMPALIIAKNEKTGEMNIIDYENKNYSWDFEERNFDLDIKNKDINWEHLDAFEKNISKEQFEKIVARAKEYIKEGDIFQANLSQRFGADIQNDESLFLYEILRKINPSPFASYVSFEDYKLISQSPERLVKLVDGKIETRPIAGTRRLRKNNEAENIRLEKELKSDEKECAEHVMMVDLERNDIGKVSKFGSVKVDEFMIVEKYSHVMHLVSNIEGSLRDDKDAFDLLKAMFPGGTITGAPKIRTMEIIEELENTRRSFYTGSLGYISFDGKMDFNIIIRSFIEKANKIYFQVGAGIVYDSVPEIEYKETINKARAMILAYENLKMYRK